MIDTLTTIAATVAGFGSGYAMVYLMKRDLLIDAQRWEQIDRLRKSGETGRVTVWNDDKAGRTTVTVRGKHTGWMDDEYVTASIDIALAQAINTLERSTNDRAR